MCRRTQGDGFRDQTCKGIEVVKKCPTGEVPYLVKRNRGFLFLYRRMAPFLQAGFGGFNDSAVTLAFDTYHVPEGKRPVYLDKVIVLISAIQEVREKEKDK